MIAGLKGTVLQEPVVSLIAMQTERDAAPRTYNCRAILKRSEGFSNKNSIEKQ